MKRILLIVVLFSICIVAQKAKVHHELKVKLIPGHSGIEVVDDITVNSSLLKESLTFTLNEKLSLELLNKELLIEITDRSISLEDIGMDREDSDSNSSLRLNKYTISGFTSNTDLNFVVKYSGKIDSPIEQSEENYQRGFSESPGIISDLGVYLAGSTYWVPTVKDELVSFNITTELPSVWRTVSQGKRVLDTLQNDTHVDTWMSSTPQEEIFLIAAKFNEYKYSVGSVDAYAFLRTPDEALANKYLETTAQYLEMYRQLVGPFPYTKFALVENFWETGYGMPSFTLLGEKIIRFPFILHSSYPHELLHNWWGNSVYVDFDSGNWCEGLTAYMADHLIKEQRGLAEEYRRSTLQKFTDYVNEKNDFPLSKFISRHDGASEAIGYGKALMVFHMLRLKVGDDNFIKGFQAFNRSNKFRITSYKDIQEAFEDVTNEDLGWFFDQWIYRTGVPELELSGVQISEMDSSFQFKFNLEQIQAGDPFIIDVPIAIINEEGMNREIVSLTKNIETYSFELNEKPLKIMVDPQFDLMRRLDSREIPPAFTKAYGAEKIIIILPENSNPKFNIYKQFVDGWIKGKEEKFIIVNDTEIDELSSEQTIWILGTENKMVNKLFTNLNSYNSKISSDAIKLNGNRISTDNNSFLIASDNPDNSEQVVLFLSIGNDNAVPGLLRKLPHYGKYSFLAFEGDEPTNIEKGQWPVLNSPLIQRIDESDKIHEPSFEKREALATLAPAFSSNRMVDHIKFLASDEMKGRELGSLELDLAADYIASRFEEYGLLAGADDGSYFQLFEKAFHRKGRVSIKNIIGIIPGTNLDLSEAVVISAHYDHLGLGWPDVRKGNEGKIHYGADDNASGVAVLLELAKSMGKSFKPSRTVIFVAFSGEEAGLVGSEYFVNNYNKYPADQILANLNFDTVGRLFERKIMILNGNSAREWKFIFMGTEYTTGIPAEIITQNLDASDQVSFVNNGIPSVQFFSGPNQDYHKPNDTIEKIDSDGLVKVATVAKEVIQYLAERKDPIDFTGERKSDSTHQTKSKSPSQGRRVSTGTMPDFAYSGEGVKIAAVSEGSPGALAGLLKGDIIKKLDGNLIKSLKDYSNLLKEHKPGDKVKMEVERNGEMKSFQLILTER